MQSLLPIPGKGIAAMQAAKGMRLREEIFRRCLQHGMMLERSPGLHLRSLIGDLDMLSAARLYRRTIKGKPQTFNPPFVERIRNQDVPVPFQRLVHRAQDCDGSVAVSYTHLRAHETPEHLVC